LLPSPTLRSFEMVFANGKAELILSSRTERDMREYVGVLESVYGELDVMETSPRPYFLREIPRIVGLEGNPGLKSQQPHDKSGPSPPPVKGSPSPKVR
ncbi:MAG: hypothetical protein LYZ70_07705, partial [Nitrososphaerales archaeon]|nr:hypothetical protein [Nitrososphaerales archaeon]